jgi:hypothetical protein
LLIFYFYYLITANYSLVLIDKKGESTFVRNEK